MEKDLGLKYLGDGFNEFSKYNNELTYVGNHPKKSFTFLLCFGRDIFVIDLTLAELGLILAAMMWPEKTSSFLKSSHLDYLATAGVSARCQGSVGDASCVSLVFC